MDLVIYDLARETPTRLTFDPAGDSYPIWTLDGERIFFASAREGLLDVFWKAADGTGQVQRLTTTPFLTGPQSWSADGQTLVVTGQRPETGVDVGVVSIDGEPTIDWVLDGDSDELSPDVSPDGRWMAYSTDESGQSEVFVTPFPNVGGERWRISRDGGVTPQWGPNSRELFYQTDEGPGSPVTMMVADNDTEPTFSPGTPVPLFEGPFRIGRAPQVPAFDISPDGQRFLMIREGPSTDAAAEQPQIILVQNWVEELKRLFPDQ